MPGFLASLQLCQLGIDCCGPGPFTQAWVSTEDPSPLPAQEPGLAGLI